MRTLITLIVIFASQLTCFCALAQDETEQQVSVSQTEQEAPFWSDLNEQQQALLFRIKNVFDRYPAERRSILAKGSEQYSILTPDQQQKLRRAVKKFRAMSKSEKQEKCLIYGEIHKQVPFFCEPFMKAQ